MAITPLPPSPNGEVSHGDVREKINEVIEKVEIEHSIVGLSLDPSSPELGRTVTLIGTADPQVSINATHIEFVDIPDQFSGDLLTANNDGTITVNQDVLAFKVTCMGIARFASNSNIAFGIGIGDPSTLPSLPGGSTGVPPLGTYISRFRDNGRGEGNTRRVTLQTPYFPVGKTRSLGAKAGDRIFVVAWTQESSNTSVVFDDIIFAVQAIPLGS